jgi:hypothetical protein
VSYIESARKLLIVIKLDKEMERVSKVLCSEDTAQFTVVPLDAGQEVQQTVTREDIVRLK